MYIIRSGEVRVTNTEIVSNQEQEIIILIEGEYFGERALLTHGMNTRMANCISRGTTLCLTLESEEFKA